MILSYYKRGVWGRKLPARWQNFLVLVKCRSSCKCQRYKKALVRGFVPISCCLQQNGNFLLSSRLSEQAMKQAMIFLLWFMTKHFSSNRSEHGESSFRLNLLMLLFIFRVPVAPRSCSCLLFVPRHFHDSVFILKLNSWAHGTAQRT